uniref:Uncharacterized protein n=1 Tax=Rhizophora mucronata TaxID=61149 RepID=A0A2P2PNS9_RHIMU
MTDQVANQQHDLTIHNKRKTRAGQPDRSPEPVPINYGVQQRRRQYSHDLKRLREFKPKKRRDQKDGLVK